ncbi:MAG: glycoside hydrolase family 16 protein [Candidatus Margulisiibacteriota bacterium]
MESSAVSLLAGSAVGSGWGCFRSEKPGQKAPSPESRPEPITVAAQNSGKAAAKPVLEDDFSKFNDVMWEKANGWTNGAPFNCGWKSDHVSFEDGKLVLKLEDTPSSGTPYTSGEYRSSKHLGYGSLEASVKAANGNGLVTSLFFYTGPSEGKPWDEIDVEILGKDPTQMQTNYITDGKGGHEKMIDLGFDASQDYHSYRIDWEKDKIVWYVDGKQVHSEDGSNGPLPSHEGKIMMNLWPGTGVDGWLKPFTYKGPIAAYYDSITYIPSAENAKGGSEQQVVKPETAPKAAAPAEKTSNGTPLTGLKGISFNSASGDKVGDGVEFSGSEYDDGMVLFEGKKLEGNLLFSWEFKDGTDKKGPFKIVFIDSNEANTGVAVINPEGTADQSVEIPKNTSKINLMAAGQPVAVKLSGFAVDSGK